LCQCHAGKTEHHFTPLQVDHRNLPRLCRPQFQAIEAQIAASWQYAAVAAERTKEPI
jgi:hypothetical protein